ncbi:MAG: site-2 protease family protein [Candidatus Bathyarchaeota archaeon]|nr:site-2 protease family protein [Candidatus Bathyarchaeota archaeon]
MSDIAEGITSTRMFQQSDFEKITQLVTAEFKIQEALLENGIPTYYLLWPQETKQAFLRLLQTLEGMELIAFLRKVDERIVLKVVPKPPMQPSNPRVNLIMLLATICTTFVTGYFMLPDAAGIPPVLSGIVFSASILTVLGVHEMGHKLTANKKRIDATAPYFIPGLPPLGTWGAVIMQKSLPPNRDALFDVGANGPVAGFIVALIFSAIGMTLLIPGEIPPTDGSLVPLSWVLLINGFASLNLIPQLVPPNNGWYMHPIGYAGWAGMVVTMLNLLPAAMLDGGHIARAATLSDKQRFMLTFTSVAVLLFAGTEFMLMAFLIVFMSMFKHPGPLDDVSGLSKSRKLLIIALIAIFVLSFPIRI